MKKIIISFTLIGLIFSAHTLINSKSEASIITHPPAVQSTLHRSLLIRLLFNHIWHHHYYPPAIQASWRHYYSSTRYSSISSVDYYHTSTCCSKTI